MPWSKPATRRSRSSSDSFGSGKHAPESSRQKLKRPRSSWPATPSKRSSGSRRASATATGSSTSCARGPHLPNEDAPTKRRHPIAHPGQFGDVGEVSKGDDELLEGVGPLDGWGSRGR